uniref:Ig-like domain-containing protein n=1 Tax=Oryzias latipes TaxID=8090 RepID=A0A3P9II57_ORYLA
MSHTTLTHSKVKLLLLCPQLNVGSLVDAETNIYTKREGEDITVGCNLTFTGSRKLLCKEICEGNILIDTYRDEDQRGRYSIKYEYRYLKSSVLHVTITKLTKSDSGLYTCELQKDWSPISKDNFKIIVTEGQPSWGPRLL